jgi:hypothetical protein
MTLTVFVLKLIALVCMFIDHLGAVFPEYFPYACRVIGRASFPLFAFCVAEGCRHTRSMPRYALRLAAFALVSQVPFSLAFPHLRTVRFLYDTNIFYTLCLGALCVLAWQKLCENGTLARAPKAVPIAARICRVLLCAVCVCVCLLASDLLGTDYGAWGVLLVFSVYIFPGKTGRLCALALMVVYRYGMFVFDAVADGFNFMPYINMWQMGFLVSALCAVALAASYNGRRGPGLKWLFYIAYPAHLMVFAGIRLWILPQYL